MDIHDLSKSKKNKDFAGKDLQRLVKELGTDKIQEIKNLIKRYSVSERHATALAYTENFVCPACEARPRYLVGAGTRGLLGKSCGDRSCTVKVKGDNILASKKKKVMAFVRENKIKTLSFPIKPELLAKCKTMLSSVRVIGLSDFFYRLSPLEKYVSRSDPHNIEHVVLNGFQKVCLKCKVNTINKSTYCSACGEGARSGDADVKAKQKETCLIRHGGQMKGSKKIRSKIEATCVERYGVDNPTANPEIHKRLEKTTRERWGGVFNGSPAIKLKGAETLKERLLENPGYLKGCLARAWETRNEKDLKNPDRVEQRRSSIETKLAIRKASPRLMRASREKRAATMALKYGEDWRRVWKDTLNKARYPTKTIRVAGKTFKCQGYEPYAIRQLVAMGIDATRISVEAETFSYYKLTGEIGYYFPDLCVKGFKESLEVKSTYTAGLLPKGNRIWKILQRKSAGVSEAGRTLRVIVIDPKLGYFTIKEPHKMTLTQAKTLINYKPFSF